jgi:hypothetical protein
MYHRGWENGGWVEDWEPLGGKFDSEPAIVAWGENRLDIFGLGTDDQMYHKWWNGSEWGPSQADWQPLGGQFISAPAVTSGGANHLHVFGIQADRQVYHKEWNGGPDWVPSALDWQALGGEFKTFPPPSKPSRLDFDAQMNFPGATAANGHIHITLNSDGTAEWSGDVRATGALPYTFAIVAAVIDFQNRAYTFSQGGQVDGTLAIGPRQVNWNESGGPPVPSLVENWGDLFGCGNAPFKWQASVSVDVIALMPNLIQGVSEVIEVVSK